MPTSPIIARADALMQRRRQSNGEQDDVPVLTDAIDVTTDESDDDIPILLEIEPFEPLSAVTATCEPDPEPESDIPVLDLVDEPTMEAAAEAPPAPPQKASLDTAIRDILAHELARRVEQRIVAELPRIIESTVRDFLAEQEMIAALQPRD